MENSNPTVLIIILIVCSVIGYVIVDKVIDYFRNNKSGTGAAYNKYEQKGTTYDYEEKFRVDAESLNPEMKYRAVFGFIGPYSTDDVKKRYRELMSKYHPDKVQHLGDEFKNIAEEKTRMIQEAYEYFKKTYNIND